MPNRGCGTRAPGGLYMCCGMSPSGRPVEVFLLDPTWPTDMPPQRAPQFLERPCPLCKGLDARERAGCPTCSGSGQRVDVLAYVGEEGYPCVPDFVEEARVMGVSRRIPKNFPVERLSANPAMYLYHRRAHIRHIVRPETPENRPIWPELDMMSPSIVAWLKEHGSALPCPRESHRSPNSLTDCVMTLWPLAGQLPDAINLNGVIERRIGDLTYRVPFLPPCRTIYTTAIFAAFPITQFQYIQPTGKAMDPELEERAKAWAVRLEAIPEGRADEPIRVV